MLPENDSLMDINLEVRLFHPLFLRLLSDSHNDFDSLSIDAIVDAV